MFFCEFRKILRNIFSFDICEFWKVFQNASFINHSWETAILMYKLQNFKHQA